MFHVKHNLRPRGTGGGEIAQAMTEILAYGTAVKLKRRA
jgi:hypothetical protein